VVNHTAYHRIQRLAFVSALCVSVSGLASAQSDAEASNYEDLLKKRYALTVKVGQMEQEVKFQEAQIEKLRGEIDTVGGTIESIPSLVSSMVDSYAKEFDKDAPFNAAERYERLAKLQEQLREKSSTPASMYRRALGMYEAEVNYGMTVEQYPGNHPLEEKAGWRLEACTQNLLSEKCSLTGEMRERIREKTGKGAELLNPSDPADAKDMKDLLKEFSEGRKLFDGNYLRVGRLALIYADVDGEEVLRYDLRNKRSGGGETEGRVVEWLPEDGSDQINLFRAVKMAKGEAAVDVMKIPVIVDADE